MKSAAYIYMSLGVEIFYCDAHIQLHQIMHLWITVYRLYLESFAPHTSCCMRARLYLWYINNYKQADRLSLICITKTATYRFWRRGQQVLRDKSCEEAAFLECLFSICAHRQFWGSNRNFNCVFSTTKSSQLKILKASHILFNTHYFIFMLGWRQQAQKASSRKWKQPIYLYEIFIGSYKIYDFLHLKDLRSECSRILARCYFLLFERPLCVQVESWAII